MLSPETACCFSPPSDITPASLSPSQPITQSVHIQGSVAGHGVGGGINNRRKCGFAGDSAAGLFPSQDLASPACSRPLMQLLQEDI